jgi:hypothetical protein
MLSCMTARQSMEQELAHLQAQRARDLLAAHTAVDRRLVMRRLVAVERLNDEIDALGVALSSLDDSTIPISICDDFTIPLQVEAPAYGRVG